MTSTNTVRNVLSVAIVTAGLALLSTDALAQRAGQELVNRPAGYTNPYNCFADEGYGRWSNCDQGGGGSN